MALLTYDELLIKEQVESSTMEQIIQNSELVDLSFKLDRWEVLAYALDFESSDIENIRSCGNMEEQGLNMLQRWKQRNVRATYEVLTRAMLRIRRADLAEVVAKMASSRASSNNQKSTAVTDCTMSFQASTCTKHEGVVTIKLNDNILYSDDHHQLKVIDSVKSVTIFSIYIVWHIQSDA